MFLIQLAQVYKTPDSYSGYIPQFSGNYEIKVIAKDSYNLIAIQTYILEVHHPVDESCLKFIIQSTTYSSNSEIKIAKLNDGSISFFDKF